MGTPRGSLFGTRPGDSVRPGRLEETFPSGLLLQRDVNCAFRWSIARFCAILSAAKSLLRCLVDSDRAGRLCCLRFRAMPETLRPAGPQSDVVGESLSMPRHSDADRRRQKGPAVIPCGNLFQLVGRRHVARPTLEREA